KLGHVEMDEGFMIFGLPPSEVAMHEGTANGNHELFLMVDDVTAFVADMGGKGITCEAPADRGWGILTTLTLPGGGKLGVYEPRHRRPKNAAAAAAPAKKAAKKKALKKKVAKKAAKPKAKAKRRGR